MSERLLSVLEPWHDWGLDLKNRRVFLYSGLGASEKREEVGSDQVVKNLLWLDANSSSKKDVVELWLNTPGGAFEEMWAIYDVIHTMRCPVVTVAVGCVASAGCLLLASGTGTRYAMPHASFMWHGGFCEGEDLVHWEAQDRAAWESRELDRWTVAMSEHTRPPKTRSRRQRADFWSRWTKGRELWLDARQMVEHGVVDEIWTREES